MPPKSKPNTCSDTAQTLPNSHKCQGFNADKPMTKRTWCKTIKANNKNDENKSGNEQEAADGVEDDDDDDPQCQEAVDEGMPWKKAPLEGILGTIVVDCAIIYFFFFVLTIIYCFFFFFFFYRKTAHDRAQDNMEQSPQRYAGHNC